MGYDFGLSKLNIQFMPYLSVHMPKVAPQNVSWRGMVIAPPAERASKAFLMVSPDLKSRAREKLSPKFMWRFALESENMTFVP